MPFGLRHLLLFLGLVSWASLLALRIDFRKSPVPQVDPAWHSASYSQKETIVLDGLMRREPQWLAAEDREKLALWLFVTPPGLAPEPYTDFLVSDHPYRVHRVHRGASGIEEEDVAVDGATILAAVGEIVREIDAHGNLRGLNGSVYGMIRH